MRRVAVLVAVAAAVLAASCSSAISTPLRVLPCTPSDERLDKQMVLMAQSVPTASAVPCLRAELDDWFLDDLDSRGWIDAQIRRDQRHLGPPAPRLLGHGGAHSARRAVADEADRVDRLPCPTGRNDHRLSL